MKPIIYILLLLTMTGLSGCSGGGGFFPIPPSDPTPEPEPVTAPRSLLVYMVANNSLGTYGCDVADLDEMLTAARQGDLGQSRLLVYHHPRRSTPSLKEVTPDGVVELISYDTSESSVSSARMERVIADFKTLAPAENYGLVLWSHGSGWLETGMESTDDIDIAPLTFGEDGGNTMNVTVLSKILDNKDFDYIYFDCCFMGGIEVVYQLRNVCDFIVASATELPLDGMPYDLNVKLLSSVDPDLTQAAQNTFEHYNALSGKDRTCTISVIDTSALDDLALATREIFALSPSLPDSYEPVPFMTSYSCYLFDFKDYVAAMTPSGSLPATWVEAFERAVIYKNQTPMLWDAISLSRHSGLSTYITTSRYSANYKNYYRLDWWTDVVESLYDSPVADDAAS